MLVVVLSLFHAASAVAGHHEGTIADIVIAASEAEMPEFSTLLAAVSAADPGIVAGV